MHFLGRFRLPPARAFRSVRLRLRDERGMALVMALGILVVLGITASSVAYYTGSQARSTARAENKRDAYSLAEAGMNAALAVLSNALNAKTATALEPCTAPTTISLDGGTAAYCGTLDTSTYDWSLTSIGTAPSPNGAAPITHTLHRTVGVRGISDGASVSAWSRFYADSTTQCMTLDGVTIPGSVAVNNCLVLRNGAKITGSTTSVDVGGNVTIVGSSASSSARAAGSGSGWTTSSNIVSSNNSYATASIAASSTSANLDATNFGFSIPSGNMIVGISASVERKESTGSPAVTYDTSSSATSATSGTTLSWSHTVASQSNRVLVVGATAEHSSSSCQASSVTYGSQAMTKITQSVAGTSTFECSSLWYLLAPNTGTNTITVTYQSSITNRTAGAIGLYNVKQAAPDASNSSFNNSGATSTSVTTLAASSWVVDVFASGQAVGDLAAGSGQTGRWTRDSGSTQSSGMSTKSVASAGATSLTWTQSGINRSAAVVAAFAPVAGSDLTDEDVYLLKAGSPVGTDHAGSSAWTTSDTTVTYGGSTDMWGTTWSLSEVNASTFGVRFKAHNPSTTASNTASVDYVSVTVYYAPVPTSRIGDSSTPVAQANISGTCTLAAAAAHAPCSSADNVFAGAVTTSAQNLGKPTIDLDYWWQNAKPGPKHPCTTSSGSVPTFDNNAGSTTTYDRSLTDNGEMTPETGSYTCQVWENGQLVGELSWNRTTRVLTVKGTIFRDGNFRFDDDGTVVHYQGRAIIYASGDLEFDEQVCAGGSGTGTCTSYPYPGSTMGTWDPTQNLLILLTDDDSEYDQGGTTCTPSGTATCPNGRKPGGFQGIAYANGDCLIHEQFQLSGPVMCNTISVPVESDGLPTFYTWPNLGSLIDGQVYITTADAEAFEMELGPTDG
jgi:Tfp pilus assembly protein PilX